MGSLISRKSRLVKYMNSRIYWLLQCLLGTLPMLVNMTIFISLSLLLYIFKFSGTHLLPEKLGVADVSVGRLVKYHNLAGWMNALVYQGNTWMNCSLYIAAHAGCFMVFHGSRQSIRGNPWYSIPGLGVQVLGRCKQDSCH